MDDKVVIEEPIEDVCSVDDTGAPSDVPPSKSDAERRLVRKLDMRIMPMICSLYFFAYLDRSNVGNARLQGLPQDVLRGDPTGVLFDWVNSAFYFPYIICQIPAVILFKLFPPRVWLGCSAIGWGLCSTLAAAAFDFPGIMVARIGLGIFEAGYAPTFPIYFALFYTREEFGGRMAYFAFGALAGACSGLIAFGIQHAHTAIANWRLLFIVEGVPTVLLGLLAIFVLPNRPEETHIWKGEEREIALERMNRGCKADVGRTLNRRHVIAGLKDWKMYAAGVIYFAGNCGTAGVTGFLPTIITTFGFENALAQVLTVPPYTVAAIVLCLNLNASDRLQLRGPFVIASCLVSGIGYALLLGVAENVRVRYFATFCVAIGIYSTIGVVIAWFGHNMGSESKKASGTPLYMAIGQCGSVLGSHLFPSTQGPRYVKGFAVSCALQFVGAVVATVLYVYYRSENRRRDSLYGKPLRTATIDTSELADDAPDYRYTP